MKSMTGYGICRVQNNDVSIEVSFRAVNGRFFENRFHLPKVYHVFEADLKKRMSEFIKRGTVDVYISRKLKSSGSHNKISINSKLAQEYLKIFRKLSKDLHLTDDVKLEMILKQPDMIQVEEAETVDTQEVKILKKVFEEALKKFELERLREGLALKKDILKNIRDLQKLTLKINKMREEANLLLQEKFEAKIKAKLPKDSLQSFDQNRISQEIIIQIEKSDINEEIVRLNEHLKNFDKLIGASVVEGKKLDFYTQELLREINTIGSKSQISGITESVVEAKTLIERLREQVQNVE